MAPESNPGEVCLKRGSQQRKKLAGIESCAGNNHDEGFFSVSKVVVRCPRRRQPRTPRASNMSPVMSQPPAVFNSGLVRMFSCVKTSNQANAAPATNRIPKTSAVYRTNGFIDYRKVAETRHGYSDSFLTRSITSFGWFMTSRICVSTSVPGRTSRSSLVFFASSTTSDSLNAFK